MGGRLPVSDLRVSTQGGKQVIFLKTPSIGVYQAPFDPNKNNHTIGAKYGSKNH
jgi:hypothetical protein